MVTALRRIASFLAGLVLLLHGMGAASAADAPLLAVNLFSSLTPIVASEYTLPPELRGYRLYVTEFDKAGRHWYRLRLGAFNERKAASAALASLRKRYPDAWLDRMTTAEQSMLAAPVGTASAPTAPAPAPVPVPPRDRPRPAVAAPVPVSPQAPVVRKPDAVATPPRKSQESPRVVALDAATLAAGEHRYVINLLVSVLPLTDTRVPELASVRGLRVYTTETERRGNSWYFLQAGFFASRADAEALLPRVRERYPEARVIKITRHELAQATGQVLAAAMPAVANDATASGGHSLLLESARLAMTRGDYDQAAALYRRAIDEGDAATARQAQELLGLAHERRGDPRAARLAYEQFLEQYPEGEDAERVRQRLAALATARDAPRAALKKAGKREAPAQYMLYGSLSAMYRRDADITDAEGERVAQSALTTYLDATGRVRSGAYDTRLRFTGSHRSDFLENGPGDDNRLSTLYLDVLNRDADWSVRLGRQSSSSGGVLGRFDGIFGGMRLSPQVRVNAVAGYPVETTAETSINSHKHFAGLSVDLSGLLENWEFQLYGIEQRADSFVDRRAVGGEARYFQQGRTFFGLADYDVHYKQLNTMMLLGSWSISDATSVNLMYDRRQSPTLSTSNALQGQTATTLDALATVLSAEQIHQLALDRTAESQTVMAGVAHTLNERYQVTADLTASQVGATPASGGVDATPETGTEYYATAQLIGRSMVWQDDITILGARLGNTRTVDSAALFFNNRVTTGRWQFNPRVQLEYRDDRSNGINYWRLKPSLIASYRRWQQHTLEAEAGAELNTHKDIPQGYYFGLNYRWDF